MVESSGNPNAGITIKDGCRYSGMYQFNNVRLSDYRSATGAEFTRDNSSSGIKRFVKTKLMYNPSGEISKSLQNYCHNFQALIRLELPQVFNAENILYDRMILLSYNR